MSTLTILSNICGWIYFLAWGLLAYPQVYLNYKLKSVEGFKLDYPFLNVTGFAFYTISFSVGFFVKGLPYNNYGLGSIRIQDLLFAYNNLLVNLVLMGQALIYKRGNNKLSTFSIFFTIFAWASALLLFILSWVYDFIPISKAFNVIIYMGYIKIATSLIKYIPVAYWNYVRKSTVGFSITSFILDIIGAVASLSQQAIDYIDGTTDIISPLKTSLGIICFFYDLILLYQHYVLYNPKRQKKQKLSKIHDVEDQTFTLDHTHDVSRRLLNTTSGQQSYLN